MHTHLSKWRWVGTAFDWSIDMSQKQEQSDMSLFPLSKWGEFLHIWDRLQKMPDCILLSLKVCWILALLRSGVLRKNEFKWIVTIYIITPLVTKYLTSFWSDTPDVGYRWVRGDPRITPGWTDPGYSGSGTGKSGKTGKTGSALFCSTTAEPGHLQTW